MTALTFSIRITEYENKIADLESETDRLSRTLESQKTAAEESQAVASKKVDELSREVQKRVHNTISCLY